MRKHRKMNKYIALILTAVLLIALLPVFAFAQSGTQGAYTYFIDGGTATITGYDQSLSGKITIPSTIGGTAVTKIDGYVFQNDTDLTQVVIPEGVVYIGEGAFIGCSSLAKVTVPDSLLNVGRMAFSGTPWYESIAEDDFVYVGNVLAAVNKEKVPAVVTLRDGTKGIAEYAFSNVTTLTAITLPESCISIGYSAFSWCMELQTVNFPKNMLQMDQNAFRGCSKLEKVTLPAGLNAVENQAFADCTALQSVVIGEDVQRIGAGAFMGCTALKSVTLPISLAVIREAAFMNCSSLENLYYAGTDEEYSAVYIYEEENEYILALKQQDPEVQQNTLYKPLSGNMIAIPYGTTVKEYYDAINEDYYYVDDGSGKIPSLEDKLRTKAAIRMNEKDYVAVILGDTDEDGEISSGDARVALRISVGLETEDAIRSAAADVNGDGKVTSDDARSVLRAAVGLDDADVWFDNI